MKNFRSLRVIFISVLITSIFCSLFLSGCSANFAEITSEAVFDTSDTAQKIGNVSVLTSEQVSSLKADMTYGEIIEALGDTENFGHLLMKFYYVDGIGILILSYDSESDICPLSGNELLSSAINLDYHGKKFDNISTKYGYITKGSNGKFMICCENNRLVGYSRFHI